MPDSFDEPPQSFDEIRLPFIFVPHGLPEPTEWLQSHPDYIKMPATFVPHARRGGRASPSPPNSPPGQHRTIDGLAVSSGGFAASPDRAAPGPPAGTARFDGMSDAPTEAADRVLIGADPIAAYCRANEALATAGSRYVSEPAVVSNPSADVGNGPADRAAPSTSLAEQVVSAIWHAIIPPAEAKEAPHTQAVHQQLRPKYENFFNQLYGPASKIAKDLNIPVEFVLGVAAKESGYYSDPHDIDFNNPWGSTHHGANDVVFGSVKDAAIYWEKSNAWRFTDGPPMTTSAFIRDLRKEPAYNSADLHYDKDLDSTIDGVRSRLAIWRQEHPQN
jgi:hypothetical protein